MFKRNSCLLYSVVVVFILGCFCNNLTLRKPVIQSSTKWAALKAVDGDRNGVGNRCSQTGNKYRNPWWIVDLLDIYLINKVVVYNRISFRGRLDQLYVEGFLHYPLLCSNHQPQLCAYHPGPSGRVVKLTCAPGFKVRYIRLRTPEYLTLCEVEVFGVRQTGCWKSRVERRTGLQLSSTTVDLGYARNPSVCSYLCSQQRDCRVFIYNRVTGSCKCPDGLFKNNTVSASDWDLYSFC